MDIDKQQLTTAVANSKSMAECLRLMNLNQFKVHYRSMWRRIGALKLSVEHWHHVSDSARHYIADGKCNGVSFQTVEKFPDMRGRKATPLEELLVDDRVVSTSSLRLRLIRNGILKDCCDDCGLMNWRGKSITLHLDHINGKSTDNRLENLRLLCPNCHSQTTTYCGRNRNRVKNLHMCKTCQKNKVSGLNKNCRACVPKRRKIQYPSEQQLLKMIANSNIKKTAKNLGISYQTLRKHFAREGYTWPGRHDI